MPNVNGMYRPTYQEVGWDDEINENFSRLADRGMNIAHSQFGATTASSNNSTAVNNAITAAGSSSHTVFIPEGIWNASALDIAYDNLTFVGTGPSSVLKLANGTNGDLFTASAQRFFVRFANLKIDGNKANNTTGNAIYAHFAHTWVFDRLHIVNAANCSIKFEGNSSFFALNNHVRACRLENSRNQNVFLASFAPNNHIDGGNIIGGTDNFYGIEDSNSENRICGNHIHTSAGYGIYLNGATSPHVQDNYVEASNQSGIMVESTCTGARVIGNTCFNNAMTSAGDGIRVAGTDASIMGNRCFDRQGTKTQDYGIQLVAGSTRNLVIGNHARTADNQTGGILDSGTANTLVNNQTA